MLMGSGDALAYRPFDSTDPAVADVGQLETELGPIGFRRDEFGRTLIAPHLILNYGFAEDWEVVLEGQAEHPLSPAEGHSRLVDNALSLKSVLRDGVLQDKPGPSVATEFAVLLPDVNGESRFGTSLTGIAAQRWSWGTVHINAGASLTRDQRAGLFLGTIIEGPYQWTVRPVAEVVYQREFGTKEEYAALVGAIWKVRDTLAFDFGLREAWLNRQPETEIRAGLTFDVSIR